MPSYSTDRRSLLRILGTVGATCAFPFKSEDLYGQTADSPPPHVHEHGAPAEPPQAQPHFFGASDFATISRIADLIIPPTETAGAVAAGVPAYIDLVVARTTDHQLVVADGLRWLDAEAVRLGGERFLALSEGQQLSLLEPLCAQYDADPNHRARTVQFFGLLKNLTADGYYTSRTGLFDELGYRGNTTLTAYPQCADEHTAKNS